MLNSAANRFKLMTKLLLALILFVTLTAGAVFSAVPVAPSKTLVSNSGWRLWLDTQASWQNDKLYLPDEVNLANMPVNPPTGGWNRLTSSAGIPVSLPGTVEEHYWGQFPARVIDPNNAGDVVRGNGSYTGVSWWYRSFVPPALKSREHLVFTFPGARLRAEVYVNGVLVGYNLIDDVLQTRRRIGSLG
jgi:beta-galactosidase